MSLRNAEWDAGDSKNAEWDAGDSEMLSGMPVIIMCSLHVQRDATACRNINC